MSKRNKVRSRPLGGNMSASPSVRHSARKITFSVKRHSKISIKQELEIRESLLSLASSYSLIVEHDMLKAVGCKNIRFLTFHQYMQAKAYLRGCFNTALSMRARHV